MKAIVGLVLLALAVSVCGASAQSTSRVLGDPQPSPTPQLDAARLMGVIRPTTIPSCGAGIVGIHGNDADTCIYSCNGVNRSKLSGTECAVATDVPTPTPTATA